MLQALKRYALFIGGAALGAVVDYAVTLGLVQLAGISATLALCLAMLVSATAVFFWHDHVTFGAAQTPGKPRRYGVFMGWSGIVYLMRAGLLAGFAALGLALPVALALAIGIASVINYLLSSRVIFRPAG